MGYIKEHFYIAHVFFIPMTTYGSSYRETCPQCGGHNFVVTPHKGFSFCFNCSHKVSDHTFKHKPITRSKYKDEIRAYYSACADYFHSCLQSEHRAWLVKRGFTDTSIEKYKLGFCPNGMHLLFKASIGQEAGLVTKDAQCTLADRIIFPFIVEDEVTDLWGRDYTGLAEAKYKGPYGSSFTRWADFPYMHDEGAYAQTVIVTEGLIKAAIANEHGFSCIGMPGTLTYRSGFKQMAGQKIVICYDNQVAHRLELKHAIIKLADRFYKPKVATLPLRGNDKQDIDSFILHYGTQAFKRCVDGALEIETWKTLVR